ncbi:MAG: alpha/beta fold hydrolase [Giesbergeria sp.]
MRIRTELHADAQRSETLLVLLPPALSSTDDFYEQGFVSAVRERHLPVDLLLADVTAQHVLDNSMVSALATQVLQPARANGYSAIWLVGISMGAFNALYCAASHADQLAGLYLMAPYTGTADVLAEIRAAGGASSWCQQQTTAQDERMWWQWLGQESLKAQWPTPVYFATGNTDRFLGGQRLLADLLPPERVRMLPGDHHWPTWRLLWEDWLDHGPLACRPPAQAAQNASQTGLSAHRNQYDN